jgi:hypothetical protein
MRQRAFADHGYAGTMSAILPTVFRFPRHLAPLARRVAVVGSFNGWDRAAHKLGRKPDDSWTITVYLPPAVSCTASTSMEPTGLIRSPMDGYRMAEDRTIPSVTSAPGGMVPAHE